MLIRVQFHHHFQFLIFIFPFSISIISTVFFFSNLYTQIFLSVTTASNQFIRFPLFLIHYSPKKILMGPVVLTQIATGLGVLAGAALLKSVIDQNPMMGPGPGSGPRCSSCNGTGRVSCLCNRWSDGDRGCRTCAGSGRMVCNSCGGSGTGRPLPVQISVRPPNRPY